MIKKHLTVICADLGYSVIIGRKIKTGKDSEQLPKETSKGRRKMGVEVDCAMQRVHGERIRDNECERRGIEEQ